MSTTPRTPSTPSVAAPRPGSISGAFALPTTGGTSGSVPRRRRGLFDAVLMSLLLYAVYAKTPLGALGETGVRMAMGQEQHPSLFSTFKGRETAVDVQSPQIVQAATLQQGERPAPIAAAAKQARVDEAALAALFSVHGMCGAAATATTCTIPTPPRFFEAVGQVTGKDTATVDEIAFALAKTTTALDGNAQLGVEALYVGQAALRRAVDAAREGGIDDAAEPDLHAEYLSPGLRRGPLQAVLPVLAVYRLETLAWPTDARFRITSPFGDRIHPVTGQKKFHNGTDIGTPTGTPLAAAHDARVKRASKDSISGSYVVLDHGLGIETTYCHMSVVSVREQDRVVRTAQLGQSGATGRVTGPHLHYILKVSGEAVDAEKYGEAPTRAGR